MERFDTTNNNPSKLTIIVPVYNVQDYLEKCVNSIENQTIGIDQIILVDDGATDQSGRIADDLARQYSNIRVIHQNNGGLSAARNTGIDAAKTDYIAFIDSDDYIDPQMYETLLSNLHRADADMSICGVWREDTDGIKSSIYPTGIHKVWNKEEALCILNSFTHFNMSFWNVVFKRELFEDEEYGTKGLRFPVGTNSEDFFLMHKVIARANKVAYTSDPYYHYVQRPGSISRSKSVTLERLDAAKSQLEFYRKWFPHLQYIAETACVFAYMSVYSSYTRKGMECPAELTNEIRKITKKYLHSVLKNDYLPKMKKYQALVFNYCPPLYRCIIKKKEHR